MTGAACARFVVNTAAAVAGVSDTMSARSSGGSDCPARRLIPTLMPAALKPRGFVTPPLIVPMVIRRAVQEGSDRVDPHGMGVHVCAASSGGIRTDRDRASNHDASPSDSTAPRAASRPDRPSSISSAVITSGGSSRTTVSAVRLTTTPRDNAAATTGAACAVQLEPPDQSGAAHLFDDRMSGGDRAQPLFHVTSDPPDVREQSAVDAARPSRRAPHGTPADSRRRCCRDRRTRSSRRPAR